MSSVRSVVFRSVAALAAAALSAPAAALTPPGSERGDDPAYRRPELVVSRESAPVDGSGDPRLAAAARRLGSLPSASDVDLRTGRFSRLQPARPLLPGRGVGNELSWEALGRRAPESDAELAGAARRAFEEWLLDHADELRLDPREMVSPVSSEVVAPDHVVLWVRRRVAGHLVRDSALVGVIRHGNLILAGFDRWGEVAGGGVARRTAEEAVLALERHLAGRPAGSAWRPPELEWIPVAEGVAAPDASAGPGLGYRLAWVVGHDLGETGRRWEALVDARDGTLLALTDTARYGSGTPRRATGGVYPVSNDGQAPDGVEQPGWPLPHLDLVLDGSQGTTDGGGNLAGCAEGSIQASLAGSFVRVQDDCGPSDLSSAGDLDFGASGGTDCVTPGVGGAGNTHAARTSYYELDRILEMARSQLPGNDWLRDRLDSNVNLEGTCNAFWDGESVSFFRSFGGCANSGEIAGVIDHEWGHGMDQNDGGAFSNPSEGLADTYAALRLDASCIGRGMSGSNCGGYGDPCLDCTGVRDVDWAKHASNAPLTVTGLLAGCVGGGAAGPCGREEHCEGQIVGQAVWDLWNRDLTAAPLGYSRDRAREVATQLTFRGSAGVTDWYSCQQGTGGCAATSGYMGYLAADDDDGDLANGTPHGTAIHAAFDRHGIACPAPPPQNSGCGGTPETPPQVTATGVDRGARLEWSPVAGAAEYRIYRAEGVSGCDSGKTLVAGTADVELVDAGLQNGRVYSYLVVPMGAVDSCFGAPSACITVVPVAGPAVDAGTGRIAPLGGDGDPFVDNCESAQGILPIGNRGTEPLTDVRIVAASSPSHPGTMFPQTFPVEVAAAIAPCESVDAIVEFVAAGLSAGDELLLELELGAAELGGETVTLTIEAREVEGDLELQASRTFDFEIDTEGWTVTSGTFERATAGGGAGGTAAYLRSSAFLPGRCDVVRSPLLQLSATSTLVVATRFDVEPLSGGWHDRANVAILSTTGARTVVAPDVVRLYNAGGAGGTCGTQGQAGWAGPGPDWLPSGWTSAALMAPIFAGQPIRLQFNYGTDAQVSGGGFQFDLLTVTDAEWQVADSQPDACTGTMPFLDGFESGDLGAWSVAFP